ncbi:MAG: hypothetical protein JJT96_04380 [Opitutales bacterium]|nr:hypothetical protein [Opitutales bacterium]
MSLLWRGIFGGLSLLLSVGLLSAASLPRPDPDIFDGRRTSGMAGGSPAAAETQTPAGETADTSGSGAAGGHGEREANGTEASDGGLAGEADARENGNLAGLGGEGDLSDLPPPPEVVIGGGSPINRPVLPDRPEILDTHTPPVVPSFPPTASSERPPNDRPAGTPPPPREPEDRSVDAPPPRPPDESSAIPEPEQPRNPPVRPGSGGNTRPTDF